VKQLLLIALLFFPVGLFAQTVNVTTPGIVSIAGIPRVYNERYVMQATDFGFLWVDTIGLMGGLVQAESKCGIGLPPSNTSIYVLGDCNGTGGIHSSGSSVIVDQFNGQCGACSVGCGGSRDDGHYNFLFLLGSSWAYVGPDQPAIADSTQTADLSGRHWTVVPTDSTALHFRWTAGGGGTPTPGTIGTITPTRIRTPMLATVTPIPPVVPTFTPGTCVNVPWGRVGPYGRCYNCAGNIVPGLALSFTTGDPCVAPGGTTPVPTLTAVPTPPILTNQMITVPIAASIHGAASSFFHSDLWIMNRSFSSTGVVTATYRCFGGIGCGAPVQITLTPRQMKYFPDVIGKTFNVPESGGAIELNWTGLVGDTIAQTRVYTPSSPPTYGFGVEGLPSSAALSGAVFTGVAGSSQNTAGFRSNAGAYNPNSFPVTITFTLTDGTTGAVLGTPFTRIWAPFEAAQISNVFAMVGAGSVTSVNGVLLVSVSGGNAFLYTVVIDNLSGDAYQIAAAPEIIRPGALFGSTHLMAARVPTGKAGLSAPMSGERARVITKRGVLGEATLSTIILVLLVCILLIYVILRKKGRPNF
jgi:hypothetical protein